ncbi:hypothetical protein [Streptomyces tsukubensis]|uniref:Uncharacterized protein n=1 Tax=Streptomyces tsukubensis TaxID=83656 RepID=A0A1V4AGB7_9ACTN|nr:hypothetical protein [Streptomyces tsukubensis]OON83066.1 hypothetical protein B1H18_02835 [Streptomyces tsukubensis]
MGTSPQDDASASGSPAPDDAAEVARRAVEVYLTSELAAWDGQLGAAEDGSAEQADSLAGRRSAEQRLTGWHASGRLDDALAWAVDEKARADAKANVIDADRRDEIRRGLVSLGWNPETGTDSIFSAE